MMTDEQLAEIKERWANGPQIKLTVERDANNLLLLHNPETGYRSGQIVHYGDAVFRAAAPADVSALLAEVERLKALTTQLADGIEAWGRNEDGIPGELWPAFYLAKYGCEPLKEDTSC